MRVREARPADLPAVMNVLDGAMLSVDAERVRTRTGTGEVLVAVEGVGEDAVEESGDAAAPADDRVLGACLLDARPGRAHVDAIAVRRRRRGQGIGSALVEAAAARSARLTAAFDADLRPFYDSLGFRVRETGAGRYWGVRDGAD